MKKFKYLKIKDLHSDKKIWYIPVDADKPAQEVWTSNMWDRNGLGGSIKSFELVDGTVDDVKGPWHIGMLIENRPDEQRLCLGRTVDEIVAEYIIMEGES